MVMSIWGRGWRRGGWWVQMWIWCWAVWIIIRPECRLICFALRWVRIGSKAESPRTQWYFPLIPNNKFPNLPSSLVISHPNNDSWWNCLFRVCNPFSRRRRHWKNPETWRLLCRQSADHNGRHSCIHGPECAQTAVGVRAVGLLFAV